ncbi:polysaccharide deacetylase family protein [Gilvimarinus sp. 1_MG-2023]|uniref:polysaccharide deacetylase family protein n=1 Tax=Gilvimarinus sp. 1_MG-2023 TaxID=3062638 RepID=UPI0026E2DF2B|nr:polysaccharide deacetylase family protein [Gilvimarinus sp. 1_MG-2023]MDO6746803.1 polysaccharide deacetylase family protein [Gilvimarinus sp. 1_MG-2023]
MSRPSNSTQRIPVLCYHGMIANTRDYLGNDHIALAQDLDTLKELGFRPISTFDLIQFISHQRSLPADNVFCLTFDDAPPHDFYDYTDPKIGPVPSIKSILQASDLFRQHPVPATCFAIASESARRELAQTCMNGERAWGSEWWQTAIDERVFSIGNHSLDHMHDTLTQTAHSTGKKGEFYSVDNYRDADLQIRRAQDELNTLTNQRTARVFAYPYGHVNRYLAEDYLPNHQDEHQQLAAFSTDGDFAHNDSSIWRIPRFVCGDHWKTPDQLKQILTDGRRN